MNVPTHNTIGMAIFRELTEREARGPANWERKYSPAVLAKPLQPERLVNLAEFDSTMRAPMPMSAQLRVLKEQRMKQRAEAAFFESRAFPHKSTRPVSAASVKLYGDKAWHTQARTEKPALPKMRPQSAPVRPGPNARRVWNFERTQYLGLRELVEPNPPADSTSVAKPWHKSHYQASILG